MIRHVKYVETEAGFQSAVSIYLLTRGYDAVCPNKCFPSWEMDVAALDDGYLLEFEVKVSGSDLEHDEVKGRKWGSFERKSMGVVASGGQFVPARFYYVLPAALVPLVKSTFAGIVLVEPDRHGNAVCRVARRATWIHMEKASTKVQADIMRSLSWHWVKCRSVV